MENNISFKELYDVSLKTTFPIEAYGRKIEKGEVIAAFDKILLATLEERKNISSANGGYGNAAQIWWEETKELRLTLSQGVFSKEQLSLMTGAKMLYNDQSHLLISKREIVETNEVGVFFIQEKPIGQIFLYDKKTGQKVEEFEHSNQQFVIQGKPLQEFAIDYQYNYYGNYQTLSVGQNLINGYLCLEGKTRVKDDITGQVTTGIIKIPKLKLLSNLSMRLGKDAVPLVGRLDAVAVPDGERGRKKVMEIIFLDEDIDSDI